MINNMGIQSAIEPGLRRVPAYSGGTRKATGAIERKKIDVPSVAGQINTRCTGGILGVAGDITSVAGCDALRDRVAADRRSSDRGLPVRVFRNEAARSA